VNEPAKPSLQSRSCGSTRPHQCYACCARRGRGLDSSVALLLEQRLPERRQVLGRLANDCNPRVQHWRSGGHRGQATVRRAKIRLVCGMPRRDCCAMGLTHLPASSGCARPPRPSRLPSWAGTRHPRRLETCLSSSRWPPWWDWELEFSPHLLKRMEDRRFTEVDLRRMLEHATGNRRDAAAGRWIIQTRHSRRAWEVIVEPLATEQFLLVVTAYPLESGKKAP